jgi:hypothetical protein
MTKCHTAACKSEATHRVYWATGPVDMCKSCSEQAGRVGVVMGFHAHIEPIPQDKASVKLAFREEGEYVNVYLQQIDREDKAIYLASFRTQMLRDTPGLFDAWKEVLKEGLKGVISGVLGADVESWEESVVSKEKEGGSA